MSGLVLQAGQQLDVSLRAAGNVAAGGDPHVDGVEQVVFDVRVAGAGSPTSTITQTAPSVRQPNFSSQPSRMPGAPAGSMAPFIGYGITLDADSLPVGELEVTAVVHGHDGVNTSLPGKITVYNRVAAPCTKVVYLDFDSGSDSNNGTSWAQAVATTRTALNLVRVNPAGSTLADYEAGGGRIICRGSAEGGGAFGFPEIHTSGDHWLTFEADAAGCTWRRIDPAIYTPGADSLFAGVTGQTTRCSMRFVGIDFVGVGPVITIRSGCTVRAWQDGGVHGSAHYLGAQQWSVRYHDDDGAALSFDAAGPEMAVAKRYATGVLRRGCTFGFAAWSFVYDCEVREFLGIAMQMVGVEAPSTFASLRIAHQRYAPRIVQGYVRMDGTAGGIAVPALTVTVPSTGVMRITGPVGGYDFGLDAIALVGSAKWGVGCSGLPSGCNGTWPVLARGSSGGAPWLELQCATATAGSVAAGVGWLVTSRLSNDQPYYDAIHPDGIQIFGSRSGDCVLDWSMVDTPAMQSYFTSDENQDRLWMENLRDDGSSLVCNLLGSNLTNSILRRITLGGSFDVSGTSYTNTEIRHVVCGTAASGLGDVAANGGVVDSCHFIGGTAYGTNSTTGAWFLGDPTTAPYSMQPQAGRLATGSALLTDPSTWRWSPSGSTRGALRNVALEDWSIGSSVVVSIGASNLQLLAPTVAPSLGSLAVALVASQVAMVGAAVSPQLGAFAPPLTPSATLLSAPNVAAQGGSIVVAIAGAAFELLAGAVSIVTGNAPSTSPRLPPLALGLRRRPLERFRRRRDEGPRRWLWWR